MRLRSITMHRLRCFLRSSRISRSLFAFIAVMAVWNLGCVGFQPMLVRLNGSSASAGMVCDAEGMIAAPTVASRSTSASTDSSVRNAGSDRASATVATPPTDRGAAGHPASTGCQSCHAPPSAPQLLAANGASVPLARTRAPVTPPSTIRAPLVPPPQGDL